MARTPRLSLAEQRAREAALRLTEFQNLEATISKQLFNLQQRASRLNWVVMLELTEDGYKVTFLDDDHDPALTVKMPLMMGDTEQWQLDTLDSRMQHREAELAAEAFKRNLADAALNKLTPEERLALRAHSNLI